jgi:hypothetical protein
VSTNSEESEAGAVYAAGNPGESGFATEIKKAIDTRLGLPFPNKKPCPTPMISSPLFGQLSLDHSVATSRPDPANSVLPPRKQGDRLLDRYWRRMQILEPLLDQERFTHAYQALYLGSDLEIDERIFVATLNTVFALSTQLDESTPAEERDETSRTFFRRAWSLLCPETIIWEPGSPELVQCLLLMCRYLQCTNNPLKLWMLLGSAVRIAQSLGLHQPASSPSLSLSDDAWKRRQLWLYCAYLDRDEHSRTTSVSYPANRSLGRSHGCSDGPQRYR